MILLAGNNNELKRGNGAYNDSLSSGANNDELIDNNVDNESYFRSL